MPRGRHNKLIWRWLKGGREIRFTKVQQYLLFVSQIIRYKAKHLLLYDPLGDDQFNAEDFFGSIRYSDGHDHGLFFPQHLQNVCHHQDTFAYVT